MAEVFFVKSGVPRFREWWVPEQSLLYKLEKLFHEAKFDKIIEGKVAIKPHMGEPGDVHYLRPAYISKLVDIVKACGGDPVVLETSGLGWLPGRTSAEKYLEAARKNGFSEETIGAPIVIADGDDGLEGIEENGVFVAKGFADVDSMILLSHLTGHIQAGFGGAIKNLGVGCVTKTGKFMVHYHGFPWIDKSICDSCGACVENCPEDAIKEFEVIRSKCLRCNVCLDICELGAVKAEGKTPVELSEQIARNASVIIGIFQRRRMGYINLLVDVIPHCDCHPHSDRPFIPDIGILASRDPVAIDKASVDLVNDAPGIPLSVAEDVGALESASDKFALINPRTNWRVQIDESEKLGIGNQGYVLKEVEM